jgi:hypothetical protein
MLHHQQARVINTEDFWVRRGEQARKRKNLAGAVAWEIWESVWGCGLGYSVKATP